MPSFLTNTDIKSDNKPAAVLELAFLLQADEFAIPEETRPNNITITVDAETRTASISATLPITLVVNEEGQPVITAVDYIP